MRINKRTYLYIVTLENPDRYKGNGLNEIFEFTIAVVRAKNYKEVLSILKKESKKDVNGDLDMERLSLITNIVFELKGKCKPGLITTYLGTYP